MGAGGGGRGGNCVTGSLKSSPGAGVPVQLRHLLDLSNPLVHLQHWIIDTTIQLFRIRIRIDLALLKPDPDPYWECGPDTYPDPGAKKSTKINNTPYKMTFVPTYGRYVLWHRYYLHKVYLSCQIQLFVIAKSDQNPDPHWFDSHWDKKLGPDPHWNQCGSETLDDTI